MAFKTSEKYKSVIYSGDCRHKLKLLFNGVELADADVYCESLKVTSRILPNGSTRFSLDNFVAKEAELVLHDIDTTIIQSPVNISIGTLVDGTYEYVPIGLFVVQDLPTTDKNKTTIKLRDYAVKFDFGYNAKPLIDENGGSVTKLQILQDICNKAGVETTVTDFLGSGDAVGIYDNSITARTYISYLAEQAGAIATIDRSGKLIFVQLKDLETVEIPLEIVEKYEDGEKYEISRVVYEDAIRKFEYGDESKDTLFINTANPYITNDFLTGTLSGSKIETSDSADAEVVNYKQYGITKQETTTGKNLFDISKVVSKWNSSTNTGVRNNNDGTLTVSTPSTSSSVLALAPNKLSDYCPSLQVGDVVYLNATTTGTQKYVYLLISENVWTFGVLRTISQNDLDSAVLWYSSGAGTTATISDIMISTSGGEYEPYTGGQPSPSPDYSQEIEVATGSVSAKSTGKNLFNGNAVSTTTPANWGITFENDILTIQHKNSYSAGAPTLELGNNLSGNYTFSYTSSISGRKMALYIDGTYSKLISNGETIEFENGKAYTIKFSAGNNETVAFTKTMMEKGSNDTDYEPHKESSITYNLGDNFFADKDYIQDGVLNKKIGKVVVTDGYLYDGGTWKGYVVNIPNKLQRQNNYLVCDRAIFDKLANKTENTVYENGANVVFVGNADDTLETLQQKFNGAIIYYELATPTQEQLTSTGELRTFEPNTIITNDLDSEMEIEYARNQTQVSQILELNKDIPLNSFKTGKIIGNPAIDAYDIIKIVDGDKEFKTLATNDLTYNGVMINTFDTQIGKEAKKENVTLTPEATFKKWAKTEIDNVEAEVRINTGNIQTVKDEMGNMYTKGQVNELVANAETGVTNTFSEAGGNNILRNTGLWFESNDTDNPYEFWLGKAKRGNNDNSTNYKTILLQNGSFIQEQEVPNGNYSISFYYRKLISNAVASVVINGKEYPLDSLETKQFYTGEQDSETGEYIVDPIVVSNNHINIEFKCDVPDGVEVYDLMCNKGTVKLAYSQNQNETTTSTVNISKGITITSSVDKNTKFKADYDGIRVLDGNNNPKTTFTDKGTETDELVVRKKATLTGLLHQEVDDQTWVTKI